MKQHKLIPLFLAGALCFGLLAGCQPKTPATSNPEPGNSSSQSGDPDPIPGGDTEQVNLTLISGPSGVGAAKLLYDNELGQSINQYNVTMATTNEEVTALLTSGQADIAALSTTVACNLYNKTDGDVQLLAVSTLGVLYLLEKGDSVHTLEDLYGKTVWCTGQGANPEYILSHLLNEAGLTPNEDVTIEWLTPQEITAKMLAEEEGICMLPVPAATVLLQKDETIRQAVDLNAQWEEREEQLLPMGGIVVRRAFLEENPQAVQNFMEEYEASIHYISDPANLNLDREDSAPNLVARYEITPTAELAALAIPQCNITFLTGENMMFALRDYLLVHYQANPASIGGSMPYDDFFYLP